MVGQAPVRTKYSLLHKGLVGARALKGSALHEILITVAVCGILSAIAIPGFLDQMNRTRRSDARRSLPEVANRLERCHSRFRAYNDSGCNVVRAGPTVSLISYEGHYLITSAVLAVDSYTLRRPDLAESTSSPVSAPGADSCAGKPSPLR